MKDVFSLKFLSKRFYRISFFGKKLRYFTIFSHKIFDVNNYYNMFFYLFNDLLNNFKMNFDQVTFHLLKYSFEDFKNLFMISNCFNHLFSCPRSIFARNNCMYCSRLYILPDNRPKNFDCIDNFKFNEGRNVLSNNSRRILNKFKIIVFYKSLDEFSTTNSDQKRCLNTFIV